ncbi:TetR/AcrR family transcriptional regulator (plasmid) [Tistrella bauzanensis]|uniref:TetR/AcrR family transcriptional regulator n=1 Tax=Tistrella arctica TaxID=3133430 RepID=A0ABU9YKY1_9PROT
MPTAARTGPARQEARRLGTIASLMAATLDLLVERGYGGLTMAGVAGRAGVSRGALTHYYPVKDALVIAAARHALDEEMARIARTAPPSGTPAQVFMALLDASERFFLAPSFTAHVELSVAARTAPALGCEYLPMIRAYRTRFDTAWIRALMRAGLTPAAAGDLVTMTNHALRGLGLSACHPDGRQAVPRDLPAIRRRLWLQLAGDPATPDPMAIDTIGAD